ncbi:MAG: 1-acyl-sn-glycerol-3-phosphate acyltransferase [Candidatus Omnitrophica bacterium]|nr:1-acyl-sn-glycerol-3-phosphate acyltransferase [Candidatus Omnitrophota bacterium]
MLYWILRLISLIILKIFFGLEAIGKENLPKKGGFILASNHVSYLDPVAIGVLVPQKLNFMAKDELFKHLLSSWFFSALGVFPVKRDSADLSALKEAMRRVKNGQPLLLFPEGTRQLPGASHAQAHAGIGFLASKLAVPVIPVFVKGSDIALPKGTKTIRLNKVLVSFGKEIFIERSMPYHDISSNIMENVRHLAC